MESKQNQIKQATHIDDTQKTLFRSPGRFPWSAFLATMSHSFPYFLMIFVGPLVHGVSRIAALGLSWILSHVFSVWECMHHRKLTAQPVSTVSIVSIVTLAFNFRFRILGPRVARPRFYLMSKTHYTTRQRGGQARYKHPKQTVHTNKNTTQRNQNKQEKE